MRSTVEGRLIRPYYQSSNVRMYHGRYEDVLPALTWEGDGKVDLLLTDPPYQETAIVWDQSSHLWVEMVYSYSLLSCRGSIWVFGSMRSLFELWREMNIYDFRFAQELVWEKHNGSNMHADRFRKVHEFVGQWYQKQSRWKSLYHSPVFELAPGRKSVVRRQRVKHWSKIGVGQYHRDEGGRRLVRSVFRERSCHGEAVWPTQKPLGLVKAIVGYSCPPGGLVLDMHMGSGTTLVAAAQLGMRAVGIDKDEKACEAAVKRLEREAKCVGISE